MARCLFSTSQCVGQAWAWRGDSRGVWPTGAQQQTRTHTLFGCQKKAKFRKSNTHKRTNKNTLTHNTRSRSQKFETRSKTPGGNTVSCLKSKKRSVKKKCCGFGGSVAGTLAVLFEKQAEGCEQNAHPTFLLHARTVLHCTSLHCTRTLSASTTPATASEAPLLLLLEQLSADPSTPTPVTVLRRPSGEFPLLISESHFTWLDPWLSLCGFVSCAHPLSLTDDMQSEADDFRPTH